ncbi:unnamed protein product [Larinioides sclopetarius]|uniref:Uncharacterized protein n=1 Tax=Larinioides sclopetarius TaxID=280406 RepID=A0AAV2B631_9ARAC
MELDFWSGLLSLDRVDRYTRSKMGPYATLPLLKWSDGQETHRVDAKLDWTFQRVINGLQDLPSTAEFNFIFIG